MNQSSSIALNEFINRHYFGDQVDLILGLISKYNLDEALNPACHFVHKALSEDFHLIQGFSNQLDQIVYQTVTHIHCLVEKEKDESKQQFLIHSCYLIARALIMDLRDAVKDHIPDYLDRIKGQISKVGIIQGFDWQKRIELLGLDHLEKLDKEDHDLSKKLISQSKPKTLKAESRLGSGKLTSYLIECGRLLEELYEIIPDQKEWMELFEDIEGDEPQVRVYKRKRDHLVLLLYQLFSEENGYIMITGGSGRNGLAPIISRVFLDENEKTLVRKPKDMLKKLNEKKDKYEHVWSDVEEIIHELRKLERQHLDGKIEQTGRK